MNKKQKKKNIELYELNKKSPGAAAGISLLLVGGGQIYIGETGRGILQLIICIALWFVFLGWIMWIVSPIDAHQMTKRYNKKLLLKYDLEESDVM